MEGFGIGAMTDNDATLLLISICAEVHPLMKDEDVALHGGMVIYTQDRRCADAFTKQFQKLRTIFCRTWKDVPPEDAILNYCCYFHILRRNDDAEKVLDFLERDDAVTAIVAFGVLPEYLAGDYVRNRIIINSAADIGLSTDEVSQIVQEFCEFVHTKPEWLLGELKKFKTSRRFAEVSDSNLMTALFAAAASFTNYFREQHDEVETEQVECWLVQAIAHLQELLEENEDLDNLTAITRKAIENYIEEKDVLICDVELVSGKAQEALDKGRAILYDRNFYFVPEEILRAACDKFLETSSLIKIKQRLREEGAIETNGQVSSNYTVKFQYTNVFGGQCRRRFLKFRRNFFETVDSLSLEERRKIHENREVEGV